MMNAAWLATREAARQLTLDPEGASRLANLAIVATAAREKGLLRDEPGTSAGIALRSAVEQIALHGTPKAGASANSWNQLASMASNAAKLADTPAQLDAWIASWQAGTPTQKTLGAYSTPWSFAVRLAQAAVRPLMKRKSFKIVDPSPGPGMLLLACFYELSSRCRSPADRVALVYRLHGVELDPIARELCCHLLWLAAAPGRADLKRIAANIVVGNALTHDWWARRAGARFDSLVMNPPWESLRHEVMGDDPHAASRAATLERLEASVAITQGLPPLFSLQGRGDRNLAKAFLELAPHLLKASGTIAALIPGAFTSDLGMAGLRQLYLDHFALEQWTGFENLAKPFPIDSRYKFGMLVGKRSRTGTKALRLRSFCTSAAEMGARHLRLSRDVLARLGGSTAMLLELQSAAELRALAQIFDKGVPFFAGGALGDVEYRRELDMTVDRKAGAFMHVKEAGSVRAMPDGSFRTATGEHLVPLVEGRMVSHYDCFQKSWVSGAARSAVWEDNASRPLIQCQPQFVTRPDQALTPRVAICDVTSATNTRTVQASLVPPRWRCGNTAPVLEFSSWTRALAATAVLNSLIFDWAARRVVSGLHLNKFYLESLVWPALEHNDVDELAALSYQLMKQNPRMVPACTAVAGDLFEHRPPCFRSRRQLLARIEVIVARGFGLNGPQLRRIYTADRTDRRGFWRFFDADRENLELVREAVSLLDGQRSSHKAVA